MVNRRSFLAGVSAAAIAAPRPTSARPPRKVIVGTAMQAFWVEHPGLEKRLDELAAIVDRMAAESKRRYNRSLDLAILPEVAITGEAGRDNRAAAVPFEGVVGERFARLARQHNSYIVVPSYFKEANGCSNGAVLVDRQGKAAGIYRKVHLVVTADGKALEGGSTPGREFPVFDCDFGKLGIQICYDMEFDSGWQELQRKGVELIAWPTQSPQRAHPAARAMEMNTYIVSSTWRNNASIFEPTGKITAQIATPGVLVEELDLSYAILPWTSKLRNGKALAEKYGNSVGFRYYEDEDLGLFWSNDAQMPIRQMVESLGLEEAEAVLARVREAYRKAGVPNY